MRRVWISDAERGKRANLERLHFTRLCVFNVIMANKVEVAVNNKMAEMIFERNSTRLCIPARNAETNRDISKKWRFKRIGRE